MKLKPILSILVATLMILSCVKHEIIPAPIPTVVLKSKFTGTVDGIAENFSEGVNGYTCTPANITNNSGSSISETFYSNIASTTTATTTPSVKIGLGVLTTAATPTTAEFNAFCNSNTSPVYKLNSNGGFEVQYTTASQAVYKSDDTKPSQTVSFSSIVQETDASGDYSKFVCNFSCYVYWVSGTPAPAGKDSIQIQNGVFKGWFKK